MASWGIVVPVLPGKESVLTAFTEQLAARVDEYAASRRAKGVTMERVYSMPTPMGTMVTAYGEGNVDFATVNDRMRSSGLEIDKFFMNNLAEIHGIDFSQPMPGPGPELILDWGAPSTVRGRGLAFGVPLLPGTTQGFRAFITEALGRRRAELDQSWRDADLTMVRDFLNVTPMGDVIAVYVEGPDPVRSNAEWAASTSPFDTWYKQKVQEFTGIDFANQPMPPVTEVWDWHTAAAAV